MKYENREQIKNYLLNSSSVTFYSKTNQVHFTGVNLEKCVLKLDKELMEELLYCCRVLGISRYII